MKAESLLAEPVFQSSRNYVELLKFTLTTRNIRKSVIWVKASIIDARCYL
ncbi:hypothetical protein [secondary endosymbiont of Ctenarytaina eucalypti]|nr:hypothetical protein [secondary endosymbiont of Ctenarytaina eucalypti]